MRETNTGRSREATPGKLTSFLHPSSLAALRAIQTIQVYSIACDFFIEGQPPGGVYILYSGCAELSTVDSQGRKKCLGLARPGAILGLSAVLSGKQHEETAAATAPSQTGFIKRQDFLDFLGIYPEAAFWTVRVLSEQVTTTLEQISCAKILPSHDDLQ